jgi:hypothetical protein
MSLLSAVLNRLATLPGAQILVGSLFAPNKALYLRLMWMARKDQRARQSWIDGRPFDGEIDRRHTRVMKKIIARYGWPGESMAGTMGSGAAWLLVQHADHDRSFQKQCLRLLEDAVEKQEVQPQHLAYLTDRVRVGEGIPQVYGTQIGHPIADPEHVDERRLAVGLSTRAEYLAQSKEWPVHIYKHGDRQPHSLSEDLER